jgi:hypothetical protein
MAVCSPIAMPRQLGRSDDDHFRLITSQPVVVVHACTGLLWKSCRCRRENVRPLDFRDRDVMLTLASSEAEAGERADRFAGPSRMVRCTTREGRATVRSGALFRFRERNFARSSRTTERVRVLSRVRLDEHRDANCIERIAGQRRNLPGGPLPCWPKSCAPFPRISRELAACRFPVLCVSSRVRNDGSARPRSHRILATRPRAT